MAASSAPPGRGSAARRSKASKAHGPKVELIESLEAADRALLELGELQGKRAKFDADCKAELAKVKQEFAAKLFASVDMGEKVSFDDREKALIAGLEQFAHENRDDLLEDGGKSLKLNHGRIGWRKSPPKLEPVKAKEKNGNAELLQTVVAWIVSRLDKFKLFAAKSVPFLRIAVAWEKDALLKGAESGEITRQELRKAGFTLNEGEDCFFAEPAKSDLVSQPSAD